MIYISYMIYAMRVERLYLYLFAAGLFVATGCTENRDDIVQSNPATELNDSEKINKFIVDCTQELYLWESLTDWEKYNN